MNRVILILVLVVLVSCKNNRTVEAKDTSADYLGIQRILEMPTNFSGQEVLVKGLTSDTTKTPFISMYRLTDETGSIWVHTNQHIPQENSEVYLTAKVNNIFSFRENAMGIHLMELHREAQ